MNWLFDLIRDILTTKVEGFPTMNTAIEVFYNGGVLP